MALPKDPEVFDAAYGLYLKGDIQKAYELLTEAAPKYPEQAQRMFEWRFDMAAKLGKLDLCEQILESALDAGCFYGEFALRKDEDLQAMQGRPGYEALVERSYLMIHQAQQLARPELTVINEGITNNGKTPLLMALHGNNSNEAYFVGHWQSLVGSEWLVALPQSSQVNGKDIFVWNDMEVTERELVDHYRGLTYEIVPDPGRTIITGFSKGGQAAINAALKQLFPIAGFIAIAPYIPEVGGMTKQLEVGIGRKLRGYFLLGKEDTSCTPGAIQLYEELMKLGIPCGIEVFPGVSHDFPPDFDVVLQRAIRFLVG